MIRLVLLSALLAASPAVASEPFAGHGAGETAPLAGQRAFLRAQLPLLGFADVDVRRLSTAQVAQITHLIHSGRSAGDTRGLIRGALRPGFLQRLIDRR
jgi:hypothetical protein